MGGDAGTMVFYGFVIEPDEIVRLCESELGISEPDLESVRFEVSDLLERRLQAATGLDREGTWGLPCLLEDLSYDGYPNFCVSVARSVRRDINPAPLGDTTIDPGWDAALAEFCGQLGIEPRGGQWMFVTWKWI